MRNHPPDTSNLPAQAWPPEYRARGAPAHTHGFACAPRASAGSRDPRFLPTDTRERVHCEGADQRALSTSDRIGDPTHKKVELLSCLEFSRGNEHSKRTTVRRSPGETGPRSNRVLATLTRSHTARRETESRTPALQVTPKIHKSDHEIARALRFPGLDLGAASFPNKSRKSINYLARLAAILKTAGRLGVTLGFKLASLATHHVSGVYFEPAQYNVLVISC